MGGAWVHGATNRARRRKTDLAGACKTSRLIRHIIRTQLLHSTVIPTRLRPLRSLRGGPTRHCIVVPGGTGARHCSTPRGSERACLRPHVDTARTIARHDSCGAHRTTHARHTSCDCANNDNGARGAPHVRVAEARSAGRARPRCGRDARAARRSSSRRRIEVAVAMMSCSACERRHSLAGCLRLRRDRDARQTTPCPATALERRSRHSGGLADASKPPGDAPARGAVRAAMRASDTAQSAPNLVETTLFTPERCIVHSSSVGS